MYTIGELSKKFNLSRGALLHYDAIGLLKPSGRTEANYRRYSDDDAERLRQICLYRETGMALDEIAEVLKSTKNNTDSFLEKHLGELNDAMQKIEIQRRIVVQMLKNNKTPGNASSIKDSFITVLSKSGIDDGALAKLHIEYEKSFPEEHQAFLEFLGIPPDEIKLIREHSKRVGQMKPVGD